MKFKINKRVIIITFCVFFIFSIISNFKLPITQITGKRDHKKVKTSELNSYTGNWDDQFSRLAGDWPSSVFVGDANNDGYNDIVASNCDSDDATILLWNSSTQDWDDVISIKTGDWAHGIFIADVDNDELNEIVCVNGDSHNFSIISWNNDTKTWDEQSFRGSGEYLDGVYVGDANNDGYNDIILSNGGTNNISIFLWNSSSEDWEDEKGITVGNAPYSVFVGDVNNDNYNDIVTANHNDDNMSIFLWNENDGAWEDEITKPTGEGPYSVFVADANNDGYNDIATANQISEDVSMFLWNASYAKWDMQTISAPGRPISIFIEDANHDGFNDLVFANYNVHNISVLLWNDDTSSWESQITRSTANYPYAVFVGDANNDGYKDIVTANGDSHNISILLWNAPPSIQINDPLENDLFGHNAPSYNVEISDPSIHKMWYSLDNGVSIHPFDSNGTINQEVWDDFSTENITISFYANDTEGYIGVINITIRKDIDDPIITIYMPILSNEFIAFSPIFNISIEESNLDSFWYTLDNGQTNNTITELVGIIDEDKWNALPNGHVTIKFYAKDKAGNEGYSYVIIVKNYSSPGISGFHIIFLVGFCCVTTIILIKQSRKTCS